VRPEQRARLALARGLGNTSGYLMMGTGRTDVPSGGIRLLVQAPEVVRAFILDGTPGVPGAGSLVLPLRATAALIGRTFTFQAMLVDPGATSGVSATNGLEIRFGDWRTR
jgi:hypothetical protein